MDREGPLLETLLDRLAECPPDFLLPPRRGKAGQIDVAAIVCDHFRAMGLDPQPTNPISELRRAIEASENHAQLISVATWLLHDDRFVREGALAPPMWAFLIQGLGDLARVVKAQACVSDADRREELARLCLKHLGMRPHGESLAQAADRLNSLDSVERGRVVNQTRDAEARARQVREMMARRAAEQAAAKTTRE